MKNIIFTTTAAISIALCTYGQQPPTSNNSTQNNNNFWTRAGNVQGQGGNVFGTRYNSPVYFYTGQGGAPTSRRAKLNGIFTSNINQYSINNYTWNQGVNTTGYLLLGRNNNSISDGQNIYTQKGAFSMLHLNGPGSSFQEYGYRPWMKTGVTFTGNRDLSYFGLRKLSIVATEEDKTETVILWSDNATSASGPDRLVFRFSGYGGSDNSSVSGNRFSDTDLDGLHVAQFTGKGFMGLGNTFGTNATGMNAANYVDPQSLLHSSYDFRTGVGNLGYGFHQITYRRDVANTIGTGETANDGLRWGIDNTLRNANGVQYLNAVVRWQENSPLVFQTDWNNFPGATTNGERLRIATVSSPGVPNTGGYGANTTRIAISIDGNNPITQPRSVLHLGRNTATSGNGHRGWMNIGTFMSDGTDNMYVGLKQENSENTDAVVNWGDNQQTGASGPDNLRFIFTSSPGQGDPSSSGANGLETGRFDPTQDMNGLPASYGKFGVGDFYTTPTPITHKLHVRGNGRFEYIPEESAEHIILGKEIDPSNPDDVSFRRLAFTNDPNDVLLGDGTWGTVNNTGGGFVECTDNTGAADLNADSKVNLNNNQLYFENNDVLGLNHVGIGYDCGDILDAKLSVQQVHPATVNESTTAISGVNSDVTSDILKTYTGVYGETNGVQPPQLRATNIGGSFSATGTIQNWAMKATIENNPVPNSQNVGLRIDILDDQGVSNFGIRGNVRGAVNSSTTGAYLTASGSFSNTPGLTNLATGGVFAGHGAQNRNVGVVGSTSGFAPGFTDPQVSAAEERFGVVGFAKGAAGGNYAIYGETDPSFANSYAGYFAGPVVMNQTSIWSDENLKENVEEMEDTDSLLNLLNPVSFDYKHTGDGERLNLPQGKRMGLLAQQVEQVFPEFVTVARHPADLDSLGNIINPALYYKVLDMEQFVPFLIKDAQVKSEKVKSLENELAEKDSLINDVNDRLTQLENCLSNLLPALCQINNTAIQENDEETQEALLHQINIELFDGENIILEQNIPNPFAERTLINYKIPTSVGDAKLLFYNNQGRMIREVKITERGAGQINVFGAELSKGTYSYTLVCDGEVISTKKMVKQ